MQHSKRIEDYFRQEIFDVPQAINIENGKFRWVHEFWSVVPG